MMDLDHDTQRGGRPLAVCINDCQIDCGQPRSDLRRLCFQLTCAFAELRWGDLTDAGLTELSGPRAIHSCRRTEPVSA